MTNCNQRVIYKKNMTTKDMSILNKDGNGRHYHVHHNGYESIYVSDYEHFIRKLVKKRNKLFKMIFFPFFMLFKHHDSELKRVKRNGHCIYYENSFIARKPRF